MSTLFLLITALLILVTLAGLTALASRGLSSFAVSRATVIALITVTAFFIEHFVGLGSLQWLWPLSSALAISVLYRDRARLLECGFLRAEAIFLIGFSYALLWRYAFPSISPVSERITDLYFIQNYLDGDRLPPIDHWFPPYHFDFYYALQHYGAALLARVFGLSAGLTYNLSFCLLAGATLALAWDYAARFLHSRAAKSLVVITLALGGTGATPFVLAMYERPEGTPVEWDINDRTWASGRFIGAFDQRANTEWGREWFPKDTSGTPPAELPSESFGYQFALGDYHPPLGGFFLLLWALALLALIEDRRARDPVLEQRATLLLAISVPLQLATNTWVFPLQGLLVLSWVTWRHLQSAPPDWRALIGGGALGAVLLYPFLAGLAQHPGGSSIRLVEANARAPWSSWLALLWPIVLLAALGLRRAEWRRLTLPLAFGALAILLLSEWVFIDDPSGDHYERTNTTMKWWGYLYTAVIIGLGSALLAASTRWVRIVTIVTLLALNLQAYNLVRYWSGMPKPEFGQIQGDGVYRRDPPTRDTIDFLAKAPEGIVLESIACGAFCEAGVTALFSGQPLFLGWPMHVQTWRGGSGALWLRKDEIDQFYRGEMPDASEWLKTNRIRYVVWARRDAVNLRAWKNLDQSIGAQYEWQLFAREGDTVLGLWRRRD